MKYEKIIFGNAYYSSIQNILSLSLLYEHKEHVNVCFYLMF